MTWNQELAYWIIISTEQISTEYHYKNILETVNIHI